MTNCRAIVTVPKTCQRCGVEFACGGGCCWCAEVPLTPDIRSGLEQQFTDCLCRSCLEAATAEQRAQRVDGDGERLLD